MIQLARIVEKPLQVVIDEEPVVGAINVTTGCIDGD
jgi:hypothetical protein